MGEYLGRGVPKMGFGGLFAVRNPGLDVEAIKQMVDAFMESGFTCFDCAYAYGREEGLIAEALVKRYPRESYQLTEKITAWKLDELGDARKCFERSLENLGVDHVDFLMLHNVSTLGDRIRIYEEHDAWSLMNEEKLRGRAKSIGFSFHDKSEVLAGVLDAHPEIDFVLLSINYLDWDDSVIQGRKNYELARSYGKSVMVMKPLNGGLLADLPPKAQSVLDEAGVDPIELAFKFCSSLEGVATVFSTANNLDQLRRNIEVFKGLKSFDSNDQALIDRVVEVMRGVDLIECTNCRYCMARCPRGIKIPWIISVMNQLEIYGDYTSSSKYYSLHTREGGRASECVRCMECVDQCPQMLQIPDLLATAVRLFEFASKMP